MAGIALGIEASIYDRIDHLMELTKADYDLVHNRILTLVYLYRLCTDPLKWRPNPTLTPCNAIVLRTKPHGIAPHAHTWGILSYQFPQMKPSNHTVIHRIVTLKSKWRKYAMTKPNLLKCFWTSRELLMSCLDEDSIPPSVECELRSDEVKCVKWSCPRKKIK